LPEFRPGQLPGSAPAAPLLHPGDLVAEVARSVQSAVSIEDGIQFRLCRDARASTLAKSDGIQGQWKVTFWRASRGVLRAVCGIEIRKRCMLRAGIAGLPSTKRPGGCAVKRDLPAQRVPQQGHQRRLAGSALGQHLPPSTRRRKQAHAACLSICSPYEQGRGRRSEGRTGRGSPTSSPIAARSGPDSTVCCCRGFALPRFAHDVWEVAGAVGLAKIENRAVSSARFQPGSSAPGRRTLTWPGRCHRGAIHHSRRATGNQSGLDPQFNRRGHLHRELPAAGRRSSPGRAGPWCRLREFCAAGRA